MMDRALEELARVAEERGWKLIQRGRWIVVRGRNVEVAVRALDGRFAVIGPTYASAVATTSDLIGAVQHVMDETLRDYESRPMFPPVEADDIAAENIVFEDGWPDQTPFVIRIGRGTRRVTTFHTVSGPAVDELFTYGRLGWAVFSAPVGADTSYEATLARLKNILPLPPPVLRNLIGFAHLVSTGKVRPLDYEVPVPLKWPAQLVGFRVYPGTIELTLEGVQHPIPVESSGLPEDLALESVTVMWRLIRIRGRSARVLPVLAIDWKPSRRTRRTKSVPDRPAAAYALARLIASVQPDSLGLPIRSWTITALADFLLTMGIARNRAEATRLARYARHATFASANCSEN